MDINQILNTESITTVVSESQTPKPLLLERTTSASITKGNTSGSLKWTKEEDNLLIELRQKGLIWERISKDIPGRSPASCRLRYQNRLEKRLWDENSMRKLELLYDRYIQSNFCSLDSQC